MPPVSFELNAISVEALGAMPLGAESTVVVGAVASMMKVTAALLPRLPTVSRCSAWAL